MVGIIGGGAELQRQQAEAALERTFLTIKAGITKRYAKEVAAIQDRFRSDTRAREAEAELDRLVGLKSEADGVISQLRGARSLAGTALEKLTAVYDAAVEGNVTAFDLALSQLNIQVGSKGQNPLDGLLGNLSPGLKGERLVFANVGSEQIPLKVHAIGTRYLLTDTGSGTVYQPDPVSRTLAIDGTAVSFDQLTVTARTGTTVTFSDGITERTAEFAQGGLDIGSAWLYDGLTGDGQSRAIGDVRAALDTVRGLIRQFDNAVGQAELGVTGLTRRSEVAGDEALRLNDQLFDERSAALKAAELRQQALERQFAFAAKLQRETLRAVIQPDPPQSKTVFGILAGN